MHTFKDNAGQEWNVEITVNTIRRVKSALQIDLMGLIGDRAFVDKLVGDPETLVNVVYVVCKPQADALGVSDEQFGERMGGDSLDDATSALLESFIDFFPSRKRPILRAAMGKLKEIEAGMLDVAEKALNSPEVNNQISTALAKLGEQFAPAPAEATAA